MRLNTALNEKDVENIYRSELVKIEGSQITSPYGVDGLLENKSIRSLLEFKYSEALKNKLSQCNVLIQCLYYLKKFELNGDKLPTTIFVGDINECFAIHTNSIVKYLSSEIDWKIAPSTAHKRNPELVQAMVGDTDILPFVYDVDDKFSIKTVIEKIREFSDNVVRKVRITKHNVVSIFDYFDKNVLVKVDMTTNEKANLFIQIVINPEENCLHPKRKNILMTKSFGDIAVNANLFNSFFQHFEGDIYSPKEKEGLTALVDRLIEDTVRRTKGEFFTPTPFVDLAHKYIADTFGEDWKERFVVWDCAWGTGNLTRDYKFKELYASTLEQSDLDTAEQMGFNMEASKFQYDFLNDPTFDTAIMDSKVPKGLQEAIKSGREILFLINPPYATANNMGTKLGDHKGGVADTVVGVQMKNDNWGSASQNLYAQFLYKITKLQEINKNIRLGVFCPPLFLSGGSYKKFREKFFSNFEYKSGFLFEACHFSDVAKNWGISFTIFGVGQNKSKFNVTLIDYDDQFELAVVGKKEIYNTDNNIKLSNITRLNLKKFKTIDSPQMTSAINIKNNGRGTIINSTEYLGTFHTAGNAIYKNGTDVGIYSNCNSNGNSHSIFTDNFIYSLSGFTARKLIQPTWINCKDEYLAPNEQHTDYEQFTHDALVYSLFNNSSQQSSLRQVTYKNKLWDIKNEFFWLSRLEMQSLADNTNYDALYRDAKAADERFVYTKLIEVYDKLSPDAKTVLDMASDLLRKSMQARKLLSENHPEYHLDTFDAGYAQLKLVWKEYFKDEFKAFRLAYKQLEDRMRPLVYELGFLR